MSVISSSLGWFDIMCIVFPGRLSYFYLHYTTRRGSAFEWTFSERTKAVDTIHYLIYYRFKSNSFRPHYHLVT